MCRPVLSKAAALSNEGGRISGGATMYLRILRSRPSPRRTIKFVGSTLQGVRRNRKMTFPHKPNNTPTTGDVFTGKLALFFCSATQAALMGKHLLPRTPRAGSKDAGPHTTSTKKTCAVLAVDGSPLY